MKKQGRQKGYKSDRKGKTQEEIYGVSSAKKIKLKTKNTWKEKIKNGWIGPFKGRHHSEETKGKISKTLTGRKNPEHSKRMKGCKSWSKGKKLGPLTEEHKKKISEALKGDKCYRWIDGRSYTASPARYGDDWSKIRVIVYKRDNYQCQECGISMSETKKPHDIHHIVPFLDTFDNSLSNLITLCRSCHRKIESELINKKKNKGKGL